MMRDLSYRKFAFDWQLARTTGSDLMTGMFLVDVREIQESGGAVVFFNVSAKIYALLKELRFTQVIPVKYSLQDALLESAEFSGCVRRGFGGVGNAQL
jgi:hypothetical protein